MSSVSYNTPSLDHKSADSVNEFLKLLDDNMLAAGLIRHDHDENATVDDYFGLQPAINYNYNTFKAHFNSIIIRSTNSTLQRQYVCSLRYRLPQGNGNTTFTDDTDNPGFKKIVLASYDDTNCIIELIISFASIITPASVTLNSKILQIMPRVYTNNVFLEADYGTGHMHNTTLAESNYNIVYNMYGKSYISLTQNHLTIAIGCHNFSGMPSTMSTHNNAYKKYMINISIYRKNGNVYVYGILNGTANHTGNTAPTVWNDDRSDVYLTSYTYKNNLTASWYYRDKNFMYYPLASNTAMLTNSLDTVVVGKVYGNTNDNTIIHIPALCITKMNNDAVTELTMPARINNELIMSNYINLGNTEAAMRPIDRKTLNYSWCFLHDETIEYTTDNL